MRAYDLDGWDVDEWPFRRRRRRRPMLLGTVALAGLWLMCGGEPSGGYLGASVFGGGGSSQMSSGELFGPCEATNVVDGDTLDVRCGEDSARVRLLNIDTPERGEAGFEEARDALTDMVNDEPFHLAFEEPGEPSYGRYGRLLGHLIGEDGRNLNEEMIRGGWGTYYTKYGEGRFPGEFEAAEEVAQDEGLGIWAN